MSEKQIRTALSILEEKGYIVSGNYNKVTYDRTKWYADKRADCICPVGQMDCAKKANGISPQGEPIPNINTNTNTNINTIPPISPRENLFEQFWEAYPRCKRKVDKDGCRRKFLKIENLEQIFPDIMASLEIWKKEWSKDNYEFVPMPSKWINQKYWTVTDMKTEREAIADNILQTRMDGYL